MIRKRIVFTKPKTAELLSEELRAIKANEALVETELTLISSGTERACILGMPNTVPLTFPKHLGYCGIGRVTETGADVKNVAPGDRVLVYHGFHADFNAVNSDNLYRVYEEDLDSREAVFTIIASMGLGGVRKAELEIGESAMVMGLGLLGIFSVQFCALSGAHPVIAVDLNPERRALALKLGADYALDPSEPDFSKKVKEITYEKGVSACIEVTGVAAALKQALDCAARQGRVVLLGCTRISDCDIDYYRQVHVPGIKIIGAHNMVRPKTESYPHHWTNRDDCTVIMRLISAGKLKVKPILSRIVKPEEAPAIYTELCESKNFPIGTLFDWS